MSELEARIAVLEAQQKHMEATIKKMSEKVDEMHELLLQARGFRWFIIGVAGLAGFFASKLNALASLIATRP